MLQMLILSIYFVHILTCKLLLLTIVCKQLLCDSVKDNSDLFLLIFIAATANHKLILREKKYEFIVSRWKGEIGLNGSLGLIWSMLRKMSYNTFYEQIFQCFTLLSEHIFASC